MKRPFVVLAIIVASLSLVQCGGPPSATEVPPPTAPEIEVPTATEVSPTETPVPTEAPVTEVPTATEVPPTETPVPTEAPATEVPTATEVPPTEMPTATEVLTTLDGKSLLDARCTVCHDLGRVKRAKKTEAEWKATVRRMVRKGAKLNQAEQEAVIQYLVETYGP